MSRLFRSCGCLFLLGKKRFLGYKNLSQKAYSAAAGCKSYGLRLNWFSPCRRRRASAESGFTLIEILVAILIFSILLTWSASALFYYQAGQDMGVATRQITSEIREAQTLAVSSGNTYRIDFSDPSRRTYQLKYYAANGWVNVRGPESLPGSVQFDSVSPPSFGGDAYLDFYARGASESGHLVLDGRYGKTKTLQVDGETVNVTVSG